MPRSSSRVKSPVVNHRTIVFQDDEKEANIKSSICSTCIHGLEKLKQPTIMTQFT